MPRAGAFVTNGRWLSTATNGPTGPAGTPVTLTWSIVPDGTSIPSVGPVVTSNFVAFWDGLMPGGSGADLTARPWFPVVAGSFDRWAALSGLSMVYEPVDDGFNHGQWAGAVGSRGDIRLAGAFLDGGGGTNAQAGFIPNGDITIDTGDAGFFGAVASSHLNARNTLTHEIGHSLGLGHVDSNTAAFLMEPLSNPAIDGPQWDDVRGVQQLYGDKNEKANGPGGNGTIAWATSLGAFAGGQSASFGLDALTGTTVLPGEVDFASIANQSDVDVYSFTIAAPTLLDATLFPAGAIYNERPSGSFDPYTQNNTRTSSNLALEILGPGSEAPATVGIANGAAAGANESLLGLQLTTPGEYFVRVTGSAATVQFYSLNLAFAELVLPGDFDLDGDVDGRDFLLWQTGLGEAYDAADLADWQSNFPTSSLASQATVPEPAAAGLLGLFVACLQRSRRRIL